ncbi:hypothetical protein BT69DRAFT_8 [Atractiella rhizophila]|nr:hypothetical protein BT69DRAFT_8 [Atractiella rhizophila]
MTPSITFFFPHSTNTVTHSTHILSLTLTFGSWKQKHVSLSPAPPHPPLLPLHPRLSPPPPHPTDPPDLPPDIKLLVARGRKWNHAEAKLREILGALEEWVVDERAREGRWEIVRQAGGDEGEEEVEMEMEEREEGEEEEGWVVEGEEEGEIDEDEEPQPLVSSPVIAPKEQPLQPNLHYGEPIASTSKQHAASSPQRPPPTLAPASTTKAFSTLATPPSQPPIVFPPTTLRHPRSPAFYGNIDKPSTGTARDAWSAPRGSIDRRRSSVDGLNPFTLSAAQTVPTITPTIPPPHDEDEVAEREKVAAALKASLLLRRKAQSQSHEKGSQVEATKKSVGDVVMEEVNDGTGEHGPARIRRSPSVEIIIGQSAGGGSNKESALRSMLKQRATRLPKRSTSPSLPNTATASNGTLSPLAHSFVPKRKPSEELREEVKRKKVGSGLSEEELKEKIRLLREQIAAREGKGKGKEVDVGGGAEFNQAAAESWLKELQAEFATSKRSRPVTPPPTESVVPAPEETEHVPSPPLTPVHTPTPPVQTEQAESELRETSDVEMNDVDSQLKDSVPEAPKHDVPPVSQTVVQANESKQPVLLVVKTEPTNEVPSAESKPPDKVSFKLKTPVPPTANNKQVLPTFQEKKLTKKERKAARKKEREEKAKEEALANVKEHNAKAAKAAKKKNPPPPPRNDFFPLPGPPPVSRNGLFSSLMLTPCRWGSECSNNACQYGHPSFAARGMQLVCSVRLSFAALLISSE